MGAKWLYPWKTNLERRGMVTWDNSWTFSCCPLHPSNSRWHLSVHSGGNQGQGLVPQSCLLPLGVVQIILSPRVSSKPFWGMVLLDVIQERHVGYWTHLGVMDWVWFVVSHVRRLADSNGLLWPLSIHIHSGFEGIYTDHPNRLSKSWESPIGKGGLSPPEGWLSWPLKSSFHTKVQRKGVWRGAGPKGPLYNC